jgi:hypothetical protein
MVHVEPPLITVRPWGLLVAQEVIRAVGPHSRTAYAAASWTLNHERCMESFDVLFHRMYGIGLVGSTAGIPAREAGALKPAW